MSLCENIVQELVIFIYLFIDIYRDSHFHAKIGYLLINFD